MYRNLSKSSPVSAARTYLAELSVESLVGPFPPVGALAHRKELLQQRHDHRIRVLHGELKAERVENAAFRDKNLRAKGGGGTGGGAKKRD